jgi:serine protease AprX
MPNEVHAASPGMIRVLVEVVVPPNVDTLGIFAIAEGWQESTGFVVDRSYRPVRIRVPLGIRAPLDGYRGKGGGGARGDRRVGTSAPGESRGRTPVAGQRTVMLRGRIERERMDALRAMANVQRVSGDVRLDPFAVGRTLGVDCATLGDPIGDVKLLARKLGVDRIWAEGYDGRGVVVGIVDAGITARGRDVNPTEIPAIPMPPAGGRVTNGRPDDWGITAVGWGQHGNMMAFDIQALAPAATLWDIRIWEPGGDFEVYLSNAIAGYRHAIDSHRLRGEPHILSNSWGLYNSTTSPEYASDPDSAFALMVEEALDEGILVLFAAGNCGEACPSTLCGPQDTRPGHSILGPNGHPRVMTIGAADLDDEWCGYSSQGPALLPPNAAKPDFCAYTRFEGFFPAADPILRDFDGGTSAANAVAAGVVALLKHRRPDLTQDEAKAVLAETAEDIWIPGFDLDTGAGIIRAKAAFDLL